MMRLLPIVVLGLLAGCVPGTRRPGAILERTGQEIVVCGQLVHVGAPVVLWTDPGGYDAYRVQRRFARPGEGEWAQISGAIETPNRYGVRARAGGVEPRTGADSWTIAELGDVVDQFVVHYDVSGTSRQCFRTLHDVRGLSVHFMLDIDGTIYQTLDVKERAWHATIANERSIGIEIAQIGAYPPGEADVLDRWYARDERGVGITLPPHLGDGGVRTPGFVGRPARDGPIGGVVNGQRLVQHDFTPEQYESLSRLLAALNAVLPRIALTPPRDADGSVLSRTLTPDEFAAFRGVLGHFHVQANKADPGPAFDWERVLARARALR